jgi:hypothetical protein
MHKSRMRLVRLLRNLSNMPILRKLGDPRFIHGVNALQFSSVSPIASVTIDPDVCRTYSPKFLGGICYGPGY